MARAMVGGLIANKYNPQNIYLVDRHIEKRMFFSEKYHIHVSENRADFLPFADFIILAVKPQGAEELCLSLQREISSDHPLIISIMAGVSLGSLEKWLGEDLAIVRAMPNTPSLIQEGATGFLGNSNVSTLQLNHVDSIFSSLGITARLASEREIDVITALSGSGPAYYFYFMESM